MAAVRALKCVRPCVRARARPWTVRACVYETTSCEMLRGAREGSATHCSVYVSSTYLEIAMMCTIARCKQRAASKRAGAAQCVLDTCRSRLICSTSLSLSLSLSLSPRAQESGVMNGEQRRTPHPSSTHPSLALAHSLRQPSLHSPPHRAPRSAPRRTARSARWRRREARAPPPSSLQ